MTTAKNGLEAIRFFHREPFDIVLTDIHMPGINGNILAKQIKSATGTIPIIAITGTPAHAGNHFDEVVPKPFELEVLLKTVASCLTGNIARPTLSGLQQIRKKLLSGRQDETQRDQSRRMRPEIDKTFWSNDHEKIENIQ